ncbi:MAG TPA: hypothetical protein DCP28_32875 [Cytophagales bacterium]|nr:hypothetical protein [Cytophagales bacterium]
MENGEVRQPLQGTWTLNFGTREMVIVNEDNDPGYLQGTYAIVEHDQDHFVLQGDWLGIPSQITLTRDAHWQF